MAFPVILFNSSTGSDSAASGAGPATALTGSGASLNSSTSIDLSADSPDLSGVAVDGSAVLFVNTTSGRKFFKITAVDNGTKIVTVANAAAVTEASRTWNLGGKRATLNDSVSRHLLENSAGALGGWTLRAEDDAAFTLSSSLTFAAVGNTTDGPITIEGDAEGRLWNITANAPHHASGGRYIRVQKFKFTCSNATRTAAIAFNCGFTEFYFHKCIFGDATNKLAQAFQRSGSTPGAVFEDCEVCYCLGPGIAHSGGAIVIAGCYIHDNTGDGASGMNVVATNSIFESNGGDGLRVLNGGDNNYIAGNVFHGNTGDGCELTGVLIGGNAYASYPACVMNNNFTANGGYGLRATSGQANFQALINFNNYGTGALANTSGARLNLNAGANDQAVDPGYADAANGNFEAGTAVKALGFPLSTRTVGANQSATNAFMDIGVQREEAGGGGGSFIYRRRKLVTVV